MQNEKKNSKEDKHSSLQEFREECEMNGIQVGRLVLCNGLKLR